MQISLPLDLLCLSGKLNENWWTFDQISSQNKSSKVFKKEKKIEKKIYILLVKISSFCSALERNREKSDKYQAREIWASSLCSPLAPTTGYNYRGASQLYSLGHVIVM